MLTLYLMNLHQISSLLVISCFLILFEAIFFLMNEKVKREEMEAAKDGFPSCFHALYVSGMSKTMNLFSKKDLSLINDKTTFFMSRWFHSNGRPCRRESYDCIFNPQTIHNLLSIIILGRKKFFGKLAKPLQIRR